MRWVLRVALGAAVALAAALPFLTTTCSSAAAVPGDRIWTRTYAPSADGDVWTAVARGPAGSVYVAGMTRKTASYAALTVARYTQGGTRLWVRTYDGPEHLGAYAQAIAVDPAGRLLVAGTAKRPGDETDILVRKYSAGGTRLWGRLYDGVAEGLDEATGLALDPAGNAYVCGSSESMGTGKNMILLKYRAADGMLQWPFMYAGPGIEPEDEDVATGLAVTAGGAVYLCGFSDNDDGSVAAVICRAKPDGDRAWSRRINLGVGIDRAWAIGLAPNGDALLTGVSIGGMSTRENVLFARYSPAGTRRWARTWDGGGDEQGLQLRVAPSGSTYVLGRSTDPGTTVPRNVLLKWSATGRVVWSRLLTPGLPMMPTRLEALALDDLENAYCGGAALGLGGVDDLIVFKYSKGGVRRWTAVYASSGDWHDDCYGLTVIGDAVYAAGSRGSAPLGISDALLIKYRR